MESHIVKIRVDIREGEVYFALLSGPDFLQVDIEVNQFDQSGRQIQSCESFLPVINQKD